MNMKEILQSFTSMIKTNVSEEYGSAKDNNHTHSNKTTLDNITDTQVYAWGKGASHAGDATVHVTKEEKEKINTILGESATYAKGEGLTFFVDADGILNVQYEEE